MFDIFVIYKIIYHVQNLNLKSPQSPSFALESHPIIVTRAKTIITNAIDQKATSRTCCILSKSKQGRCGRGCSSRCDECCFGGRLLGDTSQWKNLAGGLIERTSSAVSDFAVGSPATASGVVGLSSHEMWMLSNPRPDSVRISGVADRCSATEGDVDEVRWLW